MSIKLLTVSVSEPGKGGKMQFKIFFFFLYTTVMLKSRVWLVRCSFLLFYDGYDSRAGVTAFCFLTWKSSVINFTSESNFTSHLGTPRHWLFFYNCMPCRFLFPCKSVISTITGWTNSNHTKQLYTVKPDLFFFFCLLFFFFYSKTREILFVAG